MLLKTSPDKEMKGRYVMIIDWAFHKFNVFVGFVGLWAIAYFPALWCKLPSVWKRTGNHYPSKKQSVYNELAILQFIAIPGMLKHMCFTFDCKDPITSWMITNKAHEIKASTEIWYKGFHKHLWI